MFMVTDLVFVFCIHQNFLVVSPVQGRGAGGAAERAGPWFTTWECWRCIHVLSSSTGQCVDLQHPFLDSHFFPGETRHETNVLSFPPRHPHQSHFLLDLKCSRYQALPIICVNMVPFPRSLVTIIYNLWIQPRNKAERKWTWTWSVGGNEIAFPLPVPPSSCSFSFLDFFPNLLPQWLTLQLQFPSLTRSRVIQ